MKPGQAVTWQIGPASNPITLSGHVIGANGTTATVRSNGNLYEVEWGKLKHDPGAYHLRPSCLLCGAPCGESENRYCSYAHFHEHRRQQAADAVFRAIVDYKAANDGASPPDWILVETTGIGKMTVEYAVARLEAEGRIRRVVRGRHRDIFVTGGKWIYQEVQGGDSGRRDTELSDFAR